MPQPFTYEHQPLLRSSPGYKSLPGPDDSPTQSRQSAKDQDSLKGQFQEMRLDDQAGEGEDVSDGESVYAIDGVVM